MDESRDIGSPNNHPHDEDNEAALNDADGRRGNISIDRADGRRGNISVDRADGRRDDGNIDRSEERILEESADNGNAPPERRLSNRIRGIPPATLDELPRYGANSSLSEPIAEPRSVSQEFGRPLRRCWSGASLERLNTAVRVRNRARDRARRDSGRGQAAADARERNDDMDRNDRNSEVADLRSLVS